MDVCDCYTRRSAMRWGAFKYVERYDAWVFVDDKHNRRVREPWRVKEQHDGEPYRWVTCPFCGLDLECPPPPEPAPFCNPEE